MPKLEWTGDAAADKLISTNPTALLIGFVLDQQFPIERAFLGPLLIQERLGTLDAAKLASMSAAKVEKAFVQKPALHRYPASMAKRVQDMCAVVAKEYDNDPASIWKKAIDAKDLAKRLGSLPGIGEMKIKTITGLLAKQFDIKLQGWEAMMPQHPTLADVTTLEQRQQYQAKKRAHKAQLRAQEAKH